MLTPSRKAAAPYLSKHIAETEIVVSAKFLGAKIGAG